jgi:hypothetical protein
MADERRVMIPPPPVVALAGWLLPGLGYWLIGQRTRGLVIGITVIALYVAGPLMGGVRVIEVPGYDANGAPIANYSLFNEIRSKPWSITQVMVGPLGIASGAASVWAAHPADGQTVARGARVHGRLYEIATLYTAVAGLLNLLAILDSSGRAGREGEK